MIFYLENDLEVNKYRGRGSLDHNQMKENIEKCLATCNLQTWKSGTAEPGGRRRTKEELGNLQFANLEETKRKSKVGHLAWKKQKQK